MGETSGRESRSRKHERRRHDLLGVSGGGPGKFLNLNSLKRHFLRSLDIGEQNKARIYLDKQMQNIRFNYTSESNYFV